MALGDVRFTPENVRFVANSSLEMPIRDGRGVLIVALSPKVGRRVFVALNEL